MNILASFLLIALLLFIGFILYVLVRYVPIIERNAFDIPRYQVPEDHKSPDASSIRQFQIPYDTKHAIEANYIKSKGEKKKLVVFCHETGADLNSWYKHGYFLPEDGIDVLTFNFKPVPLTNERERPKSTYYYQWPTRKELSCLERVLSWVAVEKKGYEVALFGVSKGATVAAAAAPSPLIKSVLLDGAFSTHLTLRQYMKKWVTIYVGPERLADSVPNWVYIFLTYATLIYASIHKRASFISIEKFIAKLRKPVFMIHAGQDYHVRLEHVEKLKRLIPGITDVWIAEGAGHSEAVKRYPHEYHSRIVKFLNNTLD